MLSVNRRELAAAADVFALLDELVKPVECSSIARADGDSVRRLALAQWAIGSLADSFRVARQYPNLRDVPLEYLSKQADRLRTRLAELEADRAGVP